MGKKLSEMTLEELWELFPIFLTEHKPYWEGWYSDEVKQLESILPQAEYHHIGSTAVSGIMAKPIIDILIVVDSRDDLKHAAQLLQEHGYIMMSATETRISLNKGYTESGYAEKVFHLHIRLNGDTDEIFFRDYLIAHPDVSKEYERLKLRLWKQYEHDRDAYTDAKTEFVKKYTESAKRRTLIVCDSFKGSLTSEEVGKCVQAALRSKHIESDYLLISDGGEGYLDALKFGCPALERHCFTACDSLFRKRKGEFLRGGDTLYFSLADVVGLCLLKGDEINAYINSTFGLGLLMRKAIAKYRPKTVVLAIGGSSTNDLGLGLLEGLGAKIYSGAEKLGRVTLERFDRITRIDLSSVFELTNGIKFVTLTDVSNPLLGANGATYVYGEQKGLSKSDLMHVDSLISRVKDLLLAAKHDGKDPTNSVGSGAAGGVGFTMQAVFHSEIKSGIDELLFSIGFGERIKNYGTVITGEGCFDSQSLNGKVVSGVMKYDIENLVIISAIKKLDRDNAYSIVPDITTKENSLSDPKKYLAELIDRIF